MSECVFCPDCAIIIANDDDSGIEDGPAHRALMSSELGASYGIVGDESDIGFSFQRCGGCGQFMATDEWFAGYINSDD